MQYESSFKYECGTKYEKFLIECKETLLSTKTKYQAVDIFDTHNWGKVLLLNGLVQSAQLDEHRYHEALVHPAMTAHENPQNVLIIGGGEGATAREVLKHSSVQRCVMVDIDGELLEHCEKHLPEWHQDCFSDPRLELVIRDGIEYVLNCSEIFDVVIIDVCDGFDEDSPTKEFFTPNLYRKVKRILEIKGIIVYQAMCASVNENDSFIEVFDGIDNVFTFTKPYATYIPSFWSEWGFVIASDVHNIKTLSSLKISQVLKQRKLSDKLRFFDDETLLNMFSLPKDLRQELDARTHEKTKQKKETAKTNTDANFETTMALAAI